jgi:hypothetical protein
MAPIDAVRNPNFDAALAQQEYQNSIADFRARMLAEQNAADAMGVKYIATMGTSKPMQTEGNQDFIDSRDPNKKYTMDMVDYIDPATGEKVSRTRGVVPAPGSRFVPANQAGMYRDERGILNPIPIGGLGGMRADQAGISPEQRRILDDLMAKQAQQPIPPGGGPGGQQSTNPMVGYGSQQPGNMPIPNMPQNKMADFNNFLQQGMQRNNDFNQAAQNFAGMGGPQKSFSQVAGGIGKLNRMPKQPRPNVIPLPKTRTI